MDDSLNTIKRKKAKCKEAIDAIIRFMKMNLIPIPIINQRSRVHEDLPATTPEKEDEIQRRLKYVEPQNKEQEHIQKKANDLLTYAHVARMLNSELIAIIVLSKLKKWEEQLQNPERELSPIPAPSPAQRNYLKQKQIDEYTKSIVTEGIKKRKEARDLADTKSKYPSDLGPPRQIHDAATRAAMREQERKTIEQYKTLGAIKKSLYDIPEYDRNLKGHKMPDHALPPTAYDRNSAQSVELETQRRMDELKRQLKNALKDFLPPPLPTLPPPLSPDKRRKVKERNKAFQQQYEELGKKRIAAAEKIPEFGDDARINTLPRQTIPSPHSVMQTDKRVDVDKQRREEIERYERLGSVRKKIFDYSDSEREVRGHKLPEHALPPATSAVAQNMNQEKLKELKKLTRQLLRAVEDMPTPSLLPLQTPKISREERKRKRIRERNERLWIRTEEQGKQSRLLGENIQPPKFGEDARTITLPRQAIPSSEIEPRVDLEEQRRKDIDEHKKQGAIRKRLYSRTDAETESRIPTLPEYARTLATPRNVGRTVEAQRRYRELEEERELIDFVQELQNALGEQQPLPPPSTSSLMPPPLPPRRVISRPQIPPPPPPRSTASEEQRKRKNVRDRNDKLMTQFEEQGQKRLRTIKSSQPIFGENVRTITLPKQTMPPADPASRIDVDIRKRQRDIEHYEKMGEVKRKMFDLPNYDRNLKGSRFPQNGISLTASSESDTAQSAEPKRKRKYKTLEEQRELDNLRRQLREAIKGQQKTVSSFPREDHDDQNDRDDRNDDDNQ